MAINVQSYELVSRIPKEITIFFVFSSGSDFSLLCFCHLTESQYIYQYNGGYIVYDRFFGMWLRERIE